MCAKPGMNGCSHSDICITAAAWPTLTDVPVHLRRAWELWFKAVRFCSRVQLLILVQKGRLINSESAVFFFPAGCCPLSASSGTTGNTLPPRWNSSCGPVFPNERSVTYTHLTIVLDLVTKTASGQVDLFTRHVPLPVGAFLLSDGFIWIFGNFIQYLADFRMDPNELFALDFLYSVKNI